MTKPLELLRRASLRGPSMTRIGNTNAWAGRTTLNSGSASVTVSTNVVNSDSLVLFNTQVATVNVGSHGYVTVNSIVSGTSFAFTRSNNVAAPWNEIAMWNLVRTT